MKKVNNIRAVARAVCVVGLVGTVTSGVTFAALQSQQAVLSNNTIHSATADLRIGTSGATFAATRTGYDFRDIIPGGSPMPTDGNPMFLKNYGSAGLAVKVAVSSTPSATEPVDFNKVYISFTRVDVPSTAEEFSLSELMSAYPSGGLSMRGSISGDVTAQYQIRASMAADALNGSGVSIDDVDLVFTGTGTGL